MASLGSKFISNCRCILDIFRDTCASVHNPPIESNIFMLIDVALNMMDGDSMLSYYARETNKYWDKIDSQNETYVCDNVDVILNSVNMDSNMRQTIKNVVNSYKMKQIITIIKKNDHDNGGDDMEYIWNALSALVRLSIKYVDEKRQRNKLDLPDITFDLEAMKAKYLK